MTRDVNGVCWGALSGEAQWLMIRTENELHLFGDKTRIDPVTRPTRAQSGTISEVVLEEKQAQGTDKTALLAEDALRCSY